MSTLTDLVAAVALMKADSEIYNAILHGPSSGAGSIVTTDGGVVPTVAKKLVDMQTGGGAFVSNVTNTVVVSVASATTDLLRGAALLTAYATAKTLTPNGAALSHYNRAQVVIPPGKYKLTAMLDLDTDFVDFVAMFPASGGDILETDIFLGVDEGDGQGVSLEYFRPPPTYIYTEVDRIDCVRQSCDDIRMDGFGICQLSIWPAADLNPINFRVVGAFSLDDVDNTKSKYTNMYFWSKMGTNGWCGGVSTRRHMRGTWINCIASSNSWVLGKGLFPNVDSGPPDVMDGTFSAIMYDCQAGPQSFIGDAYEDGAFTGGAVGCKLYRCRSHGDAGFGGCGITGADIDADCYFEDCITGAKSYGFAHPVYGTFVRCIGGALSYAGNGQFYGIAIDCVAGRDSYGGRESTSDGTPEAAKCLGTLTRCKVEGSTRPLNLQGAKLRDCRFTNTTTGQDCLKLLDSNSSIYNCDVVVHQGGTGIPINAGSAKNVVAVHNRMNNATNDADGIGANVTNLIATPNNVVSNSIF